MDYSAPDQINPSATLVFVIVHLVLLGGALAWAILAARVYGRRSAEAEASVRDDAPPVLGPTIIRGTVETESESRPAVTVTIRQRGTEMQSKSTWSHRWEEIERDVRVEPFYLVLASGTPVRVEPGPDVFLVDKMEVSERGNPRTKRAVLENGEVACISGVVYSGHNPRAAHRGEAGYRDAVQSGLVLRPRRSERMLVSTEPLQGRFDRLRAVHQTWSAILGISFLLASALFFDVLLLDLAGKPIDAVVLDHRSWISRGSKGSIAHHYAISTTVGETEVNADAYRATDRGMHVPYRVVGSSGDPFLLTIGTGATIGPLRVIVAPLFVGILLVVYAVAVSGAREWYDRKKVVDSGAGRLPR